MSNFFELFTTHKENKEKVTKKEDFLSYKLINNTKEEKFISILKKDDYFKDLVLGSEEAMRIVKFYKEKSIYAPEAEKSAYSYFERMDDFIYEIF